MPQETEEMVGEEPAPSDIENPKDTSSDKINKPSDLLSYKADDEGLPLIDRILIPNFQYGLK